MNEKNAEPYYMNETKYSETNAWKGKLGEQGFSHALSDFPILCNITYGKRQKDIDHLVLTYDHLVFNECKNTREGFQMYYSWFLSHVVDRYADGLPVALYYARSLGYSTKNVLFTLTIPYLNTDPLVHKALKGLKIEVIQTKKQLLEETDTKKWYSPIRTQFLSVINTPRNSIEEKEVVDIRKEEGIREEAHSTLHAYWINDAKELGKARPPCHLCCPKSPKCPKLSKYEKKLEALREVMQPRLDRNVREARKRLPQLLREIRRLQGNVFRCIQVRKYLTYKKGYRMWYPSPD